MAPGEAVELGAYQIRFEKIEPVDGPNYDAVRGTMHVSRNGEPLFVLHPEKRQYWVQKTVQTEAGIGSFRGGNILVALGDDLGAERWSVRIQIRPLVNWIWLSAFIMAFGGALAASDPRYRAAAVARDPGEAGQVARG
jgi:cytochrome c-type biogenesis protein CcmF